MNKLLRALKQKIEKSKNTFVTENKLDFYRLLNEFSKYESQEETILEKIKEAIFTKKEQLKNIPEPFKVSGNILNGSIRMKYNPENQNRISEINKDLAVYVFLQKLVEEVLEERKLEEQIRGAKRNKEKKKKNIKVKYYDFEKKQYFEIQKGIDLTEQRQKFYEEMQNLGITLAKYPDGKLELIFKKNKKKIDKIIRDKLAEVIGKDETNFNQFKYDFLKFIENELILLENIKNKSQKNL